VTFNGERTISHWRDSKWWCDDDRPLIDSDFSDIGLPVTSEDTVVKLTHVLRKICRTCDGVDNTNDKLGLTRFRRNAGVWQDLLDRLEGKPAAKPNDSLSDASALPPVDFVCIYNNEPCRVTFVDDHFWKCWLHPDKRWVLQRKLSGEEVCFLRLYKLSPDMAKLYEFGIPIAQPGPPKESISDGH